MKTETELVPISMINFSNRDNQNLEEALVDVVDGLGSHTKGPVLLAHNVDGSYTVGDGFHRIAEAILKNKDTVRAEVVSFRDSSRYYDITGCEDYDNPIRSVKIAKYSVTGKPGKSKAKVSHLHKTDTGEVTCLRS